MSDEIVRRLRQKRFNNAQLLKESFNEDSLLREAEEDEDEEEKDNQEEITTEEGPEEEYSEEEDQIENPPDMEQSERSSPASVSSVKDPEDSEETPKKDIEVEKDDKDTVNPLDNPYAVKFNLGDEVALTYADGSATDVEASIEGYDQEGFYRIKLASGMIINGLTDIALSSLVKEIKENKCVCGCKNFINEGSRTVCDECGRIIRESISQNESADLLAMADKSRPKGKRMIRGEAHPVSTAVRPDISEAIRKVFKSQKMNEESEDNEEDDGFYRLYSLRGEFWTKLPEMREDIEELGYDVLDMNAEFVVVALSDSDDDKEFYIPISGTERTMTLDFDEAKIV